MDFEAFVNDIKINHWNVHGAEVYRQGQLVHTYGNTSRLKYPIYSATKTILSIAAGIAYDEGKIELKRTILDYLPTKVTASMKKEQIAAFQAISIERLLTMSVTGFPFRPEGESYLKYSLSCKLDRVHERRFHYSNISAYLVGVALTNAIHEDLYLYLNRNLFEPLHIENPNYVRCPDGYFYGASGMEMSVHDLSQIGLLLYNGGIYERKRIVSDEYVKLATSVQQRNQEGGYGYFIWKYQNGFSINGKWKQKCYVLPETQLIVTYLSHIEDDSHELQKSMEKHILGIPEGKDSTCNNV